MVFRTYFLHFIIFLHSDPPPFYLFLYMLPASRSVPLSVVPTIVPAESESTLYLLFITSFLILSLSQLYLTTIGLFTAIQSFLSYQLRLYLTTIDLTTFHFSTLVFMHAATLLSVSPLPLFCRPMAQDVAVLLHQSTLVRVENIVQPEL